MQLHRGRLIDHVQLRVRDLEPARRFYKAVLEVAGVPVVDGPGFFYADELFVDAGEPLTRVHLAFQAPDRATVDRFHAAALAAAAATTARPASASTIPAITPPSSLIPTATTSKPYSTAKPHARPPAWSSTSLASETPFPPLRSGGGNIS